MYCIVQYLSLQIMLNLQFRVWADPLKEVTCGFDVDPVVKEGVSRDADRFAWLGVLYYVRNMENPENRSTTAAVLIARRYSLVPSFDAGHIPTSKIGSNTRVIFGHRWKSVYDGQPVEDIIFYRNYETVTLTTLAIAVTFVDIFDVIPICLPIHGYYPGDSLHQVSISNVHTLEKSVKVMQPYSRRACIKYYQDNKLDVREMRPLFGVCAIADENTTCLLESGTTLVTRDPFGAWTLIGLGVRGPGCEAPAEFINVFSHMTWAKNILAGKTTVSMFRFASNQVLITKNWYADEETYNNPDDDDNWTTWDERFCKPRQNFPKKLRKYGNCVFPLKDDDVVYRETQIVRTTSIRKRHFHAYFHLDLMLAPFIITCVYIKVDSLKGARRPVLWVDNFCNAAPGRACHVHNRTGLHFVVKYNFTKLAKVDIIFVGKNAEPDSVIHLPEIYPRRNNYINWKYSHGYYRPESNWWWWWPFGR